MGEHPRHAARGGHRHAARAGSRMALALAATVGLEAPLFLPATLPPAVRLLLALALFGWAPGFALARAARVEEPVLFAVLTVGLSLSVTVLASTGLFYLGRWDLQVVCWVVGVVTVVSALVPNVRWWR